ncbi:hypothetical protein BGZ63DRAFT_370567 [Mariannaea sp. PMI_226]|nr:hypothetical protein BGZ63DRAFT_370567 [Mariannaea sp. PMI_226]
MAPTKKMTLAQQMKAKKHLLPEPKIIPGSKTSPPERIWRTKQTAHAKKPSNGALENNVSVKQQTVAPVSKSTTLATVEQSPTISPMAQPNVEILGVSIPKMNAERHETLECAFDAYLAGRIFETKSAFKPSSLVMLPREHINVEAKRDPETDQLLALDVTKTCETDPEAFSFMG